MTDVTGCDTSKRQYQRPRNSIFNPAAKRLLIFREFVFTSRLAKLLLFFDLNPGELLRYCEQSLYFKSQKVQRHGPETKSESKHPFIMDRAKCKTHQYLNYGFFQNVFVLHLHSLEICLTTNFKSGSAFRAFAHYKCMKTF